MLFNTLFNAHPWIPALLIVIFFVLMVGYSIFKGKKGEIPVDPKNPDVDKRRPDIGSTDSRIMPRS